MTNMKKIVATVMAVLCTATLTACDEAQPGSVSTGTATPPATSASTTKATMNEEDAAAVSEIDIGAEKLENGTVKFLSSWDINPAEGQPVPVSLEMFQTQYGGNIELVSTSWDERYTKLAVLIQSDDAPDMFSAADMDVFPKGVISGMFSPLDDYVDFESELWAPMKQVNDQFAFGGKHYVGAYNTDSQCVMFYNKNTIENNDLPDPAQLLAEGNWTWDTFWSMMIDFCNKGDNNFATDGWWFEGAFSQTTGYPYIGMSDGKIVHNLDNATLEKAQDFMLEMNQNRLPFPKAEYAWTIHPENIAAGTTLFYPVGTYALYPYNNIIQSFGDMEDVMFVPLPRCPYADEYYLPSIVEGFALCKGAKNPEGVGAYLNCCMASRDSEIAKEIGKKQAFEEHGWTQEQYDMLETVKELTNAHPVIEMYNAVNDSVAGYINNPMKEGYNNGASWIQTREQIRAAVQAELDDANKKLAE